VYQRGPLLDGLAVYLSCDTKKFHDNESTRILHNFWTFTHRAGSFPPIPLGGASGTLQYTVVVIVIITEMRRVRDVIQPGARRESLGFSGRSAERPNVIRRVR